MFNRKPDDTEIVTPASQLRPNGSTGVRSAYAETPKTIIDELLTMRGDLESEGDIQVKGKIVGNVKCKLLIVDQMATVEGGIVAEEVVIRGNTKGTIQVNKVRVEKSAIVDSEIFHQTFSAEEGAKIRGALRYKEDPLADLEPSKKITKIGKDAA